MNAIQIKDGIYWVGALDWHLRNFHGYTTNRGATYNAYLIIDEKVALIGNSDVLRELLERISSIIDPSRITTLSFPTMWKWIIPALCRP